MRLPLGFTESITFALRSLYARNGYSQYKMSKFEEYDLYARNKDFLISDSIITFTDPGGKLMALKPDVTLSIVKNSKDMPNTLQKLYYHENVYRIAQSGHGFREIMQVGLECLGNVDDYCICEVLSLAAQSLKEISPNCILDVSHLGLLCNVLAGIGIPSERQSDVLNRIGQKNIHELAAVCRDCGVSESHWSVLKTLCALSGTPAQVLPKLETLLQGICDTAPLEQLQQIFSALEISGQSDVFRLDFSVVDNEHYYNGIVFKGFVEGLPGSILSGGQYDKLMKKMKRSCGAIGFAVYTDMLERLEPESSDCDTDILLLYEDSTPLSQLLSAVTQLTAQGNRVLVQKQIPDTISYRQLAKLSGSEVEILE